MHICKLKLQKIAYCSDDCDGGGHKFFSFISRKVDTKKADQKVTMQCYCIETQNIVSIYCMLHYAWTLDNPYMIIVGS